MTDINDDIVQKFLNNERYIAQECKVAFLKIQSWQFASRTPEIGKSYLREAAIMIMQSLLNYVPNSFVLSEEGYWRQPWN